MGKKKPVILLTGYLGAGKTTVMNELLRNRNGKKIALIVNDIGSVNIDASLQKKTGTPLQMDTKMVELQNGCICCTLQDEFMTQVEALSNDPEIEAILVEASGISNPGSIAQGFLMYEEQRKSSVYLSAVVTVVDADRIHTEFLKKLEEVVEDADGEEDDADIINLVMDQIEFCNLIILNKCDLLDESAVDEVEKVIHQIQPEAEIIRTAQGKIDPGIIMSEAQFDYEKIYGSSSIQKALLNEEGHEHAEEEYGITSFVYEERRPFDYDKFMAFLEHDYPEQIIRAKGYLWFADDDIHVQLFEQAGRNASVSELSNWVAALTDEDREEMLKNYPEVRSDWDETYGDRMNQIVFIGKDYSREKLIEQLEECLE